MKCLILCYPELVGLTVADDGDVLLVGPDFHDDETLEQVHGHGPGLPRVSTLQFEMHSRVLFQTTFEA